MLIVIGNITIIFILDNNSDLIIWIRLYKNLIKNYLLYNNNAINLIININNVYLK